MSDTGRPGPERPSGPPTPPPISNWQVQRPTPPTTPVPAPPFGAATPAAPERATAPAAPEAFPPPTADRQPPTPRASGRPRWLVPVIIGVVVLVAAAIVLAIVLSSKGDATETPPPAVASTVLLPSPTPTIAPAARPATTAFASAMPTTVLQYALATSAADAEWQAAGAIEAYTETFADGGSGTATVRSGQWETPEEATAFAASLVAGLPAAPAASASPDGPALPQSGDVNAGGAKAGTYSIVDAGDGTGVAVWTNGTAVFQATVPVADVVDFYNAFPL
ncbi:hypothetical protein [Cellulomonas sp. ICMP 17802]|uniref:hypothetical protein n=1 Tax=Cellulomonas sp. ICMP 17802 TaxID=3239199 RepID=UPI00351B8000